MITIVLLTVVVALAPSALTTAASIQTGPFEYKFDKRALSWTDSEKECQRWGGHLATIRSHAQNNEFVKELKDKNMISGWIGLNDRAKEASFKWTGTVSNYTNWRLLGGNKEPNGAKKENCVEIIPGRKYGRKDWKGKWNDKACTDKYPFICERRAFEYMFNTTAMSWTASEKECERWGGNLATITSQTQNDDFVKELKKKKMVSGWIGLNDRKKEGSFVWVGGDENGGYINWRLLGGNKEPNGAKKENCGEIIPGRKYGRKNWRGKWNDKACRDKYPFICERPNSTPS